jgi:hypothetical protein
VRYARELVKLAKVSPQKFLGSKGPCIENALAEFGSAGLRLRGVLVWKLGSFFLTLTTCALAKSFLLYSYI